MKSDKWKMAINYLQSVLFYRLYLNTQINIEKLPLNCFDKENNNNNNNGKIRRRENGKGSSIICNHSAEISL